jgi:hypothetical protein
MVRATAALCVVAVVLAGCGDDSVTSARADGRSTSSIVSVPAPAPPGVPSTGDVTEELGSNPNRPDTPMGALCWARWETARTLLSEAGAGELSASSADRLSAVAKSPVRAAAEGVTRSGDLRHFADTLFAALDAVGRTGPDEAIPAARLTELFSFDGYPGAQAYADAAGTDAGCVHP